MAILFDVNFSFNMSKNVLCYYGRIILMATCGQLVCFFLISANTPFSLRRVPLSRAEVMPVDEKCGCAASERDFC